MRDAQRTLEREAKEHLEATQRYERAEDVQLRAQGVREKRFQRLQEQAIHEQQFCDVLIGAYRAANVEARRDGHKPDCFKKDPLKAHLPESLAQLDSDCGQLARATVTRSGA